MFCFIERCGFEFWINGSRDGFSLWPGERFLLPGGRFRRSKLIMVAR